MAIKPRVKTTTKSTTKTEEKTVSEPVLTEVRTTVCFRTWQLTKKKAEKIFDDMGISMSGALNLFLAQVVRDKGLPFTPTTQKKSTGSDSKEGLDTAGYVELDEMWEEL